MNREKTQTVTGVLVDLLFWLFFLLIIAGSLFVIYGFDSVLLGVATFITLSALMGYVSLKVRTGIPIDRSPILPKTSVGPDTNLKESPLLYLYFDDFAEMVAAWDHGRLEIARHDSDRRSRDYTTSEIMSDQSLFSDLYKQNLVRVRLNDGTVLCRDSEMEYWDRVTGRKQGEDVFGDLSEERQAKNAGVIAVARKLDNEIQTTVQALRRRYGME